MTYENLLLDLAQRDPNLVVMTAENRAAIRNLPEKLGPRFIDVGIAEQTLVGAAAGLALRGRTPIAHALATFLIFRAYEFIRTDVGIARLPVKLVGGVPGLLSEANGPTHQALEDIALMRAVPHMQVVCPADERDLLLALPAIIASREPCYIRYNARPAVVEHAPFEFGRAETYHDGDDVVILTYGFLLEQALDAHQRLAKRGIAARVVNLRSLKPIDEAALLDASRAELLVTFEDHFRVGGLYSIVAETLLSHRVTAKVLPIAFDERWFKPALLGDVLEHEGFTGAALARRIEQEIR